ncbi:ATP-binding protein [Spiractinospora alimapuensis]|uniref:ATP-binding protein n=1 Tax=Spiractinospora alimapuensis TaxID=2820884 RepID=UPI001F17ACD9|nr:ATP-binding protein [Spiractinospora alimapuensis]QVQ54456.1 ATP-binding protein [Spiractinospora alimapuensis]
MNSPDLEAEGGTGKPALSASDSHAAADTAVCGLAGQETAAGHARDFSVSVLARWGLAQLCEDVRLVVSELVTNAWRHASDKGHADEQIELRLFRGRSAVVCQVSDSSSREPALARVDETAESGRGLHLVERFSQEWGWEHRDGRGKVVWAAFSIPRTT